MKKISLTRRNALLSPSGISLGFGVLLLVGVFLLTRILFPNAFLWLATPLFRVGATLSSATASFRAGFADAVALARERDALLSQNAALEAQNQTLAAKVEDLSRLIGTEPTKSAGIVAGVLARPPESPYDVLILGAGESAGVSVGMTAYAQGGIPIGSVVALTSSTARVVLFSASGQVTAGWAGKTRTPITLTGMGGGTFAASAPKDAPIAAGDLVYLPGPGASPIGSVSRVENNPSASQVGLRVAPLVNLFSITWVELHS